MMDTERLKTSIAYWEANDPTGGEATHYNPEYEQDYPWMADSMDGEKGWHCYSEKTGNWIPEDSADEHLSGLIAKPSKARPDTGKAFMLGGSSDGMTAIYDESGFAGEVKDEIARLMSELLRYGRAFKLMTDGNMEVYVSDTLCTANPWEYGEERGVPTEIVDEDCSKIEATRRAIIRAHEEKNREV